MTWNIEEASDAELMREVLHRMLAKHGPETVKQLDTASMEETPLRMLKALRELASGYSDPVLQSPLKTFEPEGDEIVVVRDIEFSSLCEHHVLPFTGTVAIAYIPTKCIVGLSKLARVVTAYSRRLQVQERLTSQIANELNQLEPRGVAVLVRGTHQCCSLRGAERRVEMVTSSIHGRFREDAMARAEVMSLLGAHR